MASTPVAVCRTRDASSDRIRVHRGVGGTERGDHLVQRPAQLGVGGGRERIGSEDVADHWGDGGVVVPVHLGGGVDQVERRVVGHEPLAQLPRHVAAGRLVP